MGNGTSAKLVWTKVGVDGWSTIIDGEAVDVWKGWSRLGGAGWQTRHGGRCHRSREAAARAEMRHRRAERRVTKVVL